MIKVLLKIAYLIVVLLFIGYVIVPSPDFPAPPPESLQSDEPADTETPLRRAYFTDLTREEVINHYKDQFKDFPTIRLNYPPEEAQSIIRDQTRSSYLEELVHPFRESVYINGFSAKVRKDAIVIDGREFHQKITVRYVPSNLYARAFYVVLVAAGAYFAFIWLMNLALQYLKWARKIIIK